MELKIVVSFLFVSQTLLHNFVKKLQQSTEKPPPRSPRSLIHPDKQTLKLTEAEHTKDNRVF